MEAFLDGLERARGAGRDLSRLTSVASFFVSRVDTEIDKRLDKIGTEEAKSLKGKAGIANARLAYQLYEQVFGTERWTALAGAGGQPQRPLWASTGVKDPAYPATLYVDNLVGPDTVNTMPMATLEATAAMPATGETTATAAIDPSADLQALADAGIELDEVTDKLLVDGIALFADAFARLLAGIEAKRASS
jgi:transaldolase